MVNSLGHSIHILYWRTTMCWLEDVMGRSVEKTVFLGIGGGGDVVSAAVLALAARRCGVDSVVASIIWERYVIDPVPGPIGLGELVGARAIGGSSAIVTGSSYAVRGGRRIVPQAARVAGLLGEPVYVPEILGGYESYIAGLREIMDHVGADLVVGVDVGGDVLAVGDEEELWSPLADALGLAVLAHISPSLLAVHAPGGDGELPPGYVLERIGAVYAAGGGLGARGLTRSDIGVLEKLLGAAESEASRTPLEAYRRGRGSLAMRGGSRRVELSPLLTVTFFLDAAKAFSTTPLPGLVTGSSSIWEAMERLNRGGVYTELNLELDLREMGAGPRDLSAETIIRARRMGRERIRSRGDKR